MDKLKTDYSANSKMTTTTPCEEVIQKTIKVPYSKLEKYMLPDDLEIIKAALDTGSNYYCDPNYGMTISEYLASDVSVEIRNGITFFRPLKLVIMTEEKYEELVKENEKNSNTENN